MSSIHAWSTIIHRFLCGFICVSLCQNIKIEPTNMYIASVRAHFKINTHVWVLKLIPVHSSCPMQPRACHWDCVFWHNFSGIVRMCWTAGSWWCCLSLEVISSIPSGSTIIYRFLCELIFIFLCQGIKKLNQRIWLITIIRRFRRFWFSIWMMSCIQYICICICIWYMAKPHAGITAMGGGVRVGTRASRVSV